MQPQDVYNRAYDAATAALDEWIETLKDVADVETERAANYWRVRVRPFEVQACPVELLISRDQTFDLDIGTESLVKQPASDLTLFQPLLQAVVEGQVVCRSWSAQATGAELTREMLAHLGDGHEWNMRRLVSAGTAATELSALARDRVFLAYRRAA